jgi:hypothetical protein
VDISPSEESSIWSPHDEAQKRRKLINFSPVCIVIWKLAAALVGNEELPDVSLATKWEKWDRRIVAHRCACHFFRPRRDNPWLRTGVEPNEMNFALVHQ